MTLDEQIKSVGREIGLRRAVYPKFVASKKLTQEKADHELAAMEEVYKTLKSLAAAPPTSSWTSVSLALPDDDVTVMIAIKGGSEPVWLGYLDSGTWVNVDATLIADPVTHWKHLPEGPK